MTDREALRDFIASDMIQRPDVPELLVLDVTSSRRGKPPRL